MTVRPRPTPEPTAPSPAARQTASPAPQPPPTAARDRLARGSRRRPRPSPAAARRRDARRRAPAAAGRTQPSSELLAAWPAIVERLSAHPPTKPLISECRPVAVDGAIVTLGFPEEQAFLKEQAERRRPGIEAGIAEVIGHPVTRPLRGRQRRARPRRGSDDLVAEARRIFADELVDVGEVS